jgi:hypothetical protein
MPSAVMAKKKRSFIVKNLGCLLLVLAIVFWAGRPIPTRIGRP